MVLSSLEPGVGRRRRCGGGTVLYIRLHCSTRMLPYSLALPSEPSLRIRQGPVRAVAALLAAKVHRRIALVIVVRSIANPRRLASLRPQALHRGVALDHGAVDREVIARRPLLDIGAFHHAVEERTDECSAWSRRALSSISGGIDGRPILEYASSNSFRIEPSTSSARCFTARSG